MKCINYIPSLVRLSKATSEQVLKNFPIILEDEIRSHKGIFTKGEPFEGYIESDKRVITGQGVPSTSPLAKEVLKQLEYIKVKI